MPRASTTLPLTGYAVPLAARPGDRVSFMVNAPAAYHASVARLVHTDTAPGGPGWKEEAISTAIDGPHPPHRQRTRVGSYGRVRASDALDLTPFGVATWLMPTLPARGHAQGILSRWDERERRGWSLALDAAGRLELTGGDGTRTWTVRCAEPLTAGRWYFVTAGVQAGEARVVAFAPVEPTRAGARLVARGPAPCAPAAEGLDLLLAAIGVADGQVAGALNGKLEAPALLSEPLPAETDGGAGALAHAVAVWDMARGAPGDVLASATDGRFDGRLYNLPSRPATGHAWSGRADDPALAPEEYAAAYFREQDLSDAGWEASLALDLPHALRSGVYALRLRGGGEVDHVPFFVNPPKDRPLLPVCVLLSTYTYLAYTNAHHHLRVDFEAAGLTGRPVVHHPLQEHLQRFDELGLSLYDEHRDGSGCAFASARRPLLGLRPDFFSAVHGTRHLAADLYLVDWLEQQGVGYDAITDEVVHGEGIDDGCRVLITSSHPEYWTGAMLDALERFLRRGGRVMYLGGNGLYWVTSVHPDAPHVIEVRRGYAGTRSSSSHPGECRHTTTGELGGLWRHRGRAPNRLVGVGMAAQGWDLVPTGYLRSPDSEDPRAAFMFAGIGRDEVIGDFRLTEGGGACGDEIDRFDTALGSPEHALVVAVSQPLSDYYRLAIEDVPASHPAVTGTTSPDVRSDVVFFETPAGGAVFSVGSIDWTGALSHAGYDNNVSRLTGNVLRRFADEAPFAMPPHGAGSHRRSTRVW
ncbi:MAG TPA: N,N-dimethylformamidase beta subunit family domain-containing protein [Capillimicrobium sp.]|jgi:N,N-dimethylformamidase